MGACWFIISARPCRRVRRPPSSSPATPTPVTACAAALATLDVYQEEGIFEKVARIAGKWEAAIHDIRGAGGVVRDIRNLGVLGAV
jgi:adenosylmethionine-8-amino-7-oxononanoate aminotransferase